MLRSDFLLQRVLRRNILYNYWGGSNQDLMPELYANVLFSNYIYSRRKIQDSLKRYLYFRYIYYTEYFYFLHNLHKKDHDYCGLPFDIICRRIRSIISLSDIMNQKVTNSDRVILLARHSIYVFHSIIMGIIDSYW